MRVSAPSVWLRAPLEKGTEVEGSFVIDSMSGASPLYHSTLSGASGKGVDDIRRAGDVTLTHFFERLSVGITGATSDEDDYESLGGGVKSSVWSADKNTVFDFQIGGHYDEITSSDSPLFKDHKRAWDYSVGVSQILSPESELQANFTYSSADGYLSDPYKALDLRPRSREQWAILLRYIQSIPEWKSALHTDYRYYWDTWDITSHMVEASLYHPLSESWIIVPILRFYSQSAASFFHSEYPPLDFDSLYTADQRMAAFGAITTGVKLIKDFGEGWSTDVRFDFIQQHHSWKLGRGGSSVIEPLYGYFIIFGLNKRF
jgi:hypothetical protein